MRIDYKKEGWCAVCGQKLESDKCPECGHKPRRFPKKGAARLKFQGITDSYSAIRI